MPWPMKIRGLMLDAARLVESPSYYKRFIKFASERGVNTVVFRLTDDEGCSVRFRSHPELAVHPNALCTDDLRELARYAASRRIELIPEIESFGHSRYITHAPQHADLADGSQGGKDWRHGVTPLHPRMMNIFEDLYAEACEIIRGRYLHGGCDEVAWGAHEHSVQLLKTRSREQVWAEYLNALCAIAKRLGREFIVWADHVLRQEPAIMDHLERSVILLDWDYAEQDSRVVSEFANKALSKGFRIIGGPGLIWCRWGCRPGMSVLRNIDAYVEAYRALEDDKALGIIVTNWIPGRYLQDGIWDGLAYASKAMVDGATIARNEAFADFVETMWGSKWNDDWEDLFHSLYAYVENRVSCSPSWMRPAQPIVWADESGLKSVLKDGRRCIPPFARLVKLMKRLSRHVRRGKKEYEALLLTVSYLNHIYWRAAVVCKTKACRWSGRSLTELISEINLSDRQMVEKLIKDWNRGRTKDVWRSMKGHGGPEDTLVSHMAEAAAFSAELSEHPKEFERILFSK